MRQRLPLILSATALVIALLGTTPLGQAATRAIAAVVPLAKVALNANKLNGHKSSTSPGAGMIPVVGSSGKLSSSIIPTPATTTTTTTTPTASSITGYQQITQVVSVPANATDYITDMTCPGTKFVLSGSFNPTYPADTFSSHQTGNNTWEFRNRNTSGSTVELTGLYIICANAST